MPAEGWPGQVHRALARAGVRLVGYVPDAGLKRLIELCRADRRLRAVPLSTEEEGIGLAAGAWLGGARSALLMQSSGVGNTINVLGMLKTCRLPLAILVTMRGEAGEFNTWQAPMGEATPAVFKAMGVRVRRARRAEEVAPLFAAALASPRATAVLVSQKVLGIKSFQEQRNQ
jgi:sulfopyruvate decarboxylase alpha subunit